MKSHNKPKRERKTTRAEGQAFADRKQRNRKRRKETIRWLLGWRGEKASPRFEENREAELNP